MKYPPRKIIFMCAVLCAAPVGILAQSVTYLGENYEETSKADYVYKRVIKYREPIINLNPGTTSNGLGITVHPQPSGLHICSLIDYYRTGEPALVVNLITFNVDCTQGSFDGQAISYYRNGNLKQKSFYKIGKLYGLLITYNEDGTEKRRVEYENGNRIEENKFAVPANFFLVGMWKYVEYYERQIFTGIFANTPPSVKQTIIATFYQNGILEINVNNSLTSTTEKTNWKFIPKNETTGILEQYLGDDLLYRGDVRRLNGGQFEYINTFHQNANMIG